MVPNPAIMDNEPNAQSLFLLSTQRCYSDFHSTAFGKGVQFLSVLALTPADPDYKDNLKETFGLGALKALLAKAL
jgi:hypothetical protein